MVVDSFISDFSAISKSSLYIWKFLVHVRLKPSLMNFEHYLANLWKEHSILWHGFSLGLNESWPFPVLWPLLSFPCLLTYWVHTGTASSFRIGLCPSPVTLIPGLGPQYEYLQKLPNSHVHKAKICLAHNFRISSCCHIQSVVWD